MSPSFAVHTLRQTTVVRAQTHNPLSAWHLLWNLAFGRCYPRVIPGIIRWLPCLTLSRGFPGPRSFAHSGPQLPT